MADPGTKREILMLIFKQNSKKAKNLKNILFGKNLSVYQTIMSQRGHPMRYAFHVFFKETRVKVFCITDNHTVEGYLT